MSKHESVTENLVDGVLVSEIDGWYEVVTKDAEGEAHVHRLYKHSTKERPAPEERTFINQAQPTIIRPTKRSKPTRDCQTEVFFGDTHHPFQDRNKLHLAQIALRELQPDRVTFLGDDLDNANFSRFETRKEWGESTQRGLDEFAETLAQTRANTDAPIIVHEGNHNVRLEKQIRNYNGDLMGLRRAGAAQELGVLTIGFLMDFEQFGAEYITGYPESEYWHSDTLRSYHGNRATKGSTVNQEIKDQTTNFIHGHTHRAGIVYKTFKDGRHERTIFGAEAGTFADPNQIPSGKFSADQHGNALRQTQDWQTGLLVVHHNEEIVVPQFIPITDKVMINGRSYGS